MEAVNSLGGHNMFPLIVADFWGDFKLNSKYLFRSWLQTQAEGSVSEVRKCSV